MRENTSEHLNAYENVRGLMADGDVIAFSGKGAFSEIIKARTGSIYSHVGIVTCMNMGLGWGDSVLIVESTTLTNLKDAVHGDMIKGVQLHFLSKRLDAYKGEAWWVPLSDPSKIENVARMRAWLREVHNKRVPYDTLQALGAGIDWWDGFSLENDPDFQRLFCSELVSEAHVLLGHAPEDRELWNPSENTPEDVVTAGWMAKPHKIL